jgi:acyl carrier protein
MTTLEQYNKAFIETFGVGENELSELAYQSVPAWDSVGHMAMIATLEDTFDIMMETDDIIDFSSYSRGIKILKKYDVEF